MTQQSACVCVCVERNYSVINVQKAQMEVKRMSCPGGRISCQMKTATTLWIATEVLHCTRRLVSMYVSSGPGVGLNVGTGWFWFFLWIYF